MQRFKKYMLKAHRDFSIYGGQTGTDINAKFVYGANGTLSNNARRRDHAFYALTNASEYRESFRDADALKRDYYKDQWSYWMSVAHDFLDSVKQKKMKYESKIMEKIHAHADYLRDKYNRGNGYGNTVASIYLDSAVRLTSEDLESLLNTVHEEIRATFSKIIENKFTGKRLDLRDFEHTYGLLMEAVENGGDEFENVNIEGLSLDALNERSEWERVTIGAV